MISQAFVLLEKGFLQNKWCKSVHEIGLDILQKRLNMTTISQICEGLVSIYENARIK